MAEHPLFGAIVEALKAGQICEPFTCGEVENACPALREGLSQGFLDAHAVGNPEGNPELFEKVEPGKYRCSKIGDYAI